MPQVTLTCVCGTVFKRHGSVVRPGGTYFCSKKCRRSQTERADGTYLCGMCQKWLPPDAFKKWKAPRYKGGVRRDAYCIDCKAEYQREYSQRPESKARAKVQHAQWRERCIQGGGDKAVRWWFTRQMGGYLRRARKAGLGFDLDADFLLALYHRQEGCCFYTGAPLEWESFGKKTVSRLSMTVDRRDPSRGYVQDNVVLCTHLCNTAKRDLTEEDFYEFCRLVLANRRQREGS